MLTYFLVKKDEVLITNLSGENSQFIRFNNAKIRQTGIVDDINFSITLISNNRKCSVSMTLKGLKLDDEMLREESVQMEKAIKVLMHEYENRRRIREKTKIRRTAEGRISKDCR